jgi:hypothetical protein
VGAEGSIPLLIIRGNLHLRNKVPGNRFKMAFPCPSSGLASISLEGNIDPCLQEFPFGVDKE